MTQHEFNKLPGLVLRKQFMDVTGLSDRDLDELTVTCNALSNEEIGKLRRVGLVPVFRPRISQQNPHGKYYKQDAARMGGFTM